MTDRIIGLSRDTGSPVGLEVDKAKNLYVNAGGGKYSEAALAGRMFHASTQTHVGTSTTKNNTFTGIALVNPASSGKVYIVHEFSWGTDNSPTADTVLSLAVGAIHSGYAADLSVLCTRPGHGTSQAIVDTAATITGSALTIVKHIASLGTNLTTDLLTHNPPVDLGGSIILDPGRVVCTDTILGSGAFLFMGFMWEEIDA